MAASILDLITGVATGDQRPAVTTLTAQKIVGASSISCDSLNGWEVGTAVHFAIYRKDAQGVKVPGSQTDWKGVVSGSSIINLDLRAGDDDIYPIGSVVECMPTAAWAEDLVAGLLTSLNADGTLKNSVVSSSQIVDGAVTSNDLATNAVTATKIATDAILLGKKVNPSGSSQSAGATPVDITAGSLTVTVPAGGRAIEIYAYMHFSVSNGGDTEATLSLLEDNVEIERNYMTPSNGGRGYPLSITTIRTPAAGSHTYKMQFFKSGITGGTVTYEGGTAKLIVKVV